MLESWQITHTAESDLTLHYLPADTALEDVERIHVYVQDANGTWTKRDATIDGRYLIFGMAQDETVFCTIQMPVDYTPYYLAACGAGILITAILITYTVKKMRQSKKVASITDKTA